MAYQYKYTRSKSISSMLVFYERLKDEGQEELYNTAKSDLTFQKNDLDERNRQSEYFFQLARAEEDKEKRVLQKIFGVNIGEIDYNKKDSIKDFIDTLNNCLNLKKVYDANIQLIKENEAKKSIVSWFGSYFSTAWNKEFPTIYRQLISAMENCPRNQKFVNACAPVLEAGIENVISLAIDNMMTNKLSDKVDMNEKKAYTELLQALTKIGQRSQLEKRLRDIYHIDDLKKSILQTIDKKKRKIPDKFNDVVKNVVEKNVNARGGLSLEAIEESILSIIGSQVKGNNFHVVSANATGEKHMKADNYVAIGFDASILEEALEEGETGTREKNIKLLDDLGEKLSKLNDSYIIYSSDKNYSLTDNFTRRGGFSGTSDMSALQYMGIMDKVNKNMRTFIGVMLNTASGAVGANSNLRGTINDAIARDFAYLLFDDFNTIGRDITRGVNGIHIFNLNGVMIPLSFLLNIYGRAIEQAERNPTSIISASYSTPGILWEKPGPESMGYTAWQHQREVALKETRISVHFLASFKSLVKEYL